MPIDRPTFSESWYRVAALCPRLRSSVQVFRQHFRGQMWHVLQDPGSNQFFRLNDTGYHFVGLLDGRRTVTEVWNICNQQLGDDELDEELDEEFDSLLDRDLTSLRRTSVAPALDMEVSSVSRQKSTIGRSPAAIFVITEQMIRRSGYRSIPEVLRLAPGVQVARIDGNKWSRKRVQR